MAEKLMWYEYFESDGESTKNGKNKNNILFLRELISVLDPAEVADLVKKLAQAVDDLQIAVTILDDSIRDLLPRVSSLETKVNNIEIEKQPMLTSDNAGDRITITGSGTELKITADDQLPDLEPYVKKTDYEPFVNTTTSTLVRLNNQNTSTQNQVTILNKYKPIKRVLDSIDQNPINDIIKGYLGTGKMVMMQVSGTHPTAINCNAGFIFTTTTMQVRDNGYNVTGGCTPDFSHLQGGIYGSVWFTGYSNEEIARDYWGGRRWRLSQNGPSGEGIMLTSCVLFIWDLNG